MVDARKTPIANSLAQFAGRLASGRPRFSSTSNSRGWRTCSQNSRALALSSLMFGGKAAVHFVNGSYLWHHYVSRRAITSASTATQPSCDAINGIDVELFERVAQIVGEHREARNGTAQGSDIGWWFSAQAVQQFARLQVSEQAFSSLFRRSARARRHCRRAARSARHRLRPSHSCRTAGRESHRGRSRRLPATWRETLTREPRRRSRSS